MSCTCTCIKPPYSNIEPGWMDGYPSTPIPVVADQWNEYVVFNIPQNTFVVTIPFSVIKASANIVPHGVVIVNTVDVNQNIIKFNVTNITTSGVTILMDQQVTTPNYYIKGLWSVIG